MLTQRLEIIITSSSSSPPPWKYHVFLSFRGEDTRYNFTGHLCTALRQKGINTFMDDCLSRGEKISTALLKAIEESRISVIVFSEDYASSSWCLDELVKILDCEKSNKQMVIPVFYKVSPSDVRDQKGRFGDGLAGLECKYKDNGDKIHKWRQALSQAGLLSGWPLLDKNEDESKLIHNIVEWISARVINRTYLHVADYPVGIEHRAQEVNDLLHVGRNDVRMVGLWGTGGIGKSTIAKDVYNNLISHNFEGSCFLSEVREKSMTEEGLAKLQETLLYEILGDDKLKVASVDKGITLIKERLSSKRILLVVDDVNEMKQLRCLAGGSDGWFGMGSRIIITTRDKKLLTAHHHNISIHEVKELNYHESLELFSWNAFKSKGPLDGYAELADHATRRAQGLPLILRVLGSHLYGGSIDNWQDILDGLIKSREIRDVLKISYDALDEDVKKVFLDIACFFKGGGSNYVIEILEGCGLNPKYSIDVLIKKALVNIDCGVIWMHDLVEKMGKEEVRLESPDDPGERSRLWFHDDVYRVLTENTGTKNITGIKVQLLESDNKICLSARTFSDMKNLKIFINCNGQFSGAVDNLPNNLRIVDWPGCPLKSLPLNFNPKNLVRLNMRNSHITGFGEGFKMIRGDGDMRLIRWMDISNCQRLCENLALDVSKMASVLLHQAGKCYEVLNIILSGSEVPNWFSCRTDVCVVFDYSTSDRGCICEIFIEIPRTFKWKNTGLVFCATSKITQNFSGQCCFSTRTAINGVPIEDDNDCLVGSKETDAAHVWLKYIPLPAHIKSEVDEGGDQSKPYLCRVSVHHLYGKGLLLNGCGVHLGNFSMPEDGGEDDDDVGGEVGPRKKKRMLAIKS